MAAMAIENEDDAEAGAAAEEDKVEMIVIQLLKIACVPKGPLKRCYSDLLQKFQDLKIISAAAAALSELEFRALFEELFKLHIHESLDSPTAAFWQGTVPSRFEAEFENLGELGRGAFGIVYKCKSKLEEKIYAVKVINIPENTKKEDKLKVLREVITLSQLEHDNVVRYYTSWVQDIIDTDTPVVASPEAAAAVTREPPSPSAGTPSPSAGTPCAGYDMDNFLAAYEAGEFAEASCPAGTPAQHPLLPVPSSNDAASQAPSNVARKLYIQMEYCEEKLSDYLADKNRFDLLNRKKIFRQLVAALAHIHSLGIVHRDLAPKNVLLNAELSVKLGDFGLSKVLDGNAGDSNVGTPWYMAPEIGSGSPTSTKADIYALGVIAIELAGFMEPLPKHKVLESLKSGLVLPASIPRDVADLICKLLAKAPASRPSAAELLEDQEWASFPGTSILPSRCLTVAAPPSTVAGTTV